MKKMMMKMNEKRIEYLLSFMEMLNLSQSTEHNVNRELNIVTKELMYELGLDNPKPLEEEKKYEAYLSIIKEMVGKDKFQFNYFIDMVYYAAKDALKRFPLEIKLPYIRQAGASTNAIAICRLYGPDRFHFVVPYKWQKQELSRRYSDVHILAPHEIRSKSFPDALIHVFILDDGATIADDNLPSHSSIIKLIGVEC
jgi:hypothetical protein